MRADDRPRPTDGVLAAFGAIGDPTPVSGGRDLAWRVGDLLFKPADGLPQELEWQATVLAAVPQDGFRLSFPQRAANGALVVDGWTTWSFLAGEHRAARWPDVIAVGARFHRAIAHLPRPSFIAERTDPWAIGDRVAFGETSVDRYLDVPHVARLAGARRPVDAPDQPIHGDLTGNVLFADDVPPAVIDLSPYWRPAAFATAIVVADALVWEGADETLLDALTTVEPFDQMLVRALLYRLVAAVEGGFEAADEVMAERYRPAAELALRLVARD